MAAPEIPLVDLSGTVADPELRDAVARVLASAQFVLGPEVASFEGDFATYCGTAHTVGVGSGTAALHLALRALEVGPGDRVVTVAHTFHATAEAIHQAGAEVTFVDVDDVTGGMDPEALTPALEGARVVLPVHLYGQPVDMGAVLAAARSAEASVVEDAAQAHGATVVLAGEDGPRRVGSLGDVAAFSFYPGKNLGAVGDGGAVTTNDAARADRVRRLRDHGRTSRYVYAEPGYCDRLDTLQAAVLQVKLRRLDDGNAARRRHAERYRRELHAGGDLRLPVDIPGRPSVYHLFVVRTGHRDALLEHLDERGVRAGVHYPVPLHLQPAWQHLGYRDGQLPVTEAWARECLSLPIYPQLSDRQHDRVVRAVRDFFARHH